MAEAPAPSKEEESAAALPGMGALVGAGADCPQAPGAERIRPSKCTKEALVRSTWSITHELGTLKLAITRGPHDAPIPTVLVNVGCYSALAKQVEGEAPLYATRGYAFVVAWNSGPLEEVADRVFLRWHADAAAILDWLGEQAWCDGRVAVHGLSLMGSTAFAAVSASAAPDRPEKRARVTSCVTTISFARIRPTVFLFDQGLAAELVLRFLWLAEVGVREGSAGIRHLWGVFKFFGATEFPGLLDAVRQLPIDDADLALWSRENSIWRRGMAERAEDGAFWSGGADVLCDIATVGDQFPPITLIGGWWDIFVRQTFADYAAALAVHGETAKDKVRLKIYAGGHFGVAGHAPAISRSTLAWHDQNLQPEQEGLPSSPVSLEIYGAEGEFLDCDAWPPQGFEHQAFYFHSAGSSRLGELMHEPPTRKSHPLSYVYDPRNPTPYAGGGWLNMRRDGPKTQRGIEKRADVLVLTSAPMTEQTDAVGIVTAELFVGSSAPECDFVARLCVVRAPTTWHYVHLGSALRGLGVGASMNLCESIVRVDFGGDPISPQAFMNAACCRPCSAPHSGTPREDVQRIEIELGPVGCRLFPGDRLRLQVCSAAHPLALRHPLNADGDWLGDCQLGPPARQLLYADPERPSRVLIPLRVRGTASGQV